MGALTSHRFIVALALISLTIIALILALVLGVTKSSTNPKCQNCSARINPNRGGKVCHRNECRRHRTQHSLNTESALSQGSESLIIDIEALSSASSQGSASSFINVVSTQSPRQTTPPPSTLRQSPPAKAQSSTPVDVVNSGSPGAGGFVVEDVVVDDVGEFAGFFPGQELVPIAVGDEALYCLNANLAAAQKARNNMRRCEPFAICHHCGIVLFPGEGKWVDGTVVVPPYRANLSYGYELIYNVVENRKKRKGCPPVRVSCCDSCKKSPQRFLFDNHGGDIPEEIRALVTHQQRDAISLATIYCRTLRPQGKLTYLHLHGSISMRDHTPEGITGVFYPGPPVPPPPAAAAPPQPAQPAPNESQHDGSGTRKRPRPGIVKDDDEKEGEGGYDSTDEFLDDLHQRLKEQRLTEDQPAPPRVSPVSNAIRWLKQENELFKIFRPVGETMHGFFPSATATSTHAVLPQLPANVTLTGNAARHPGYVMPVHVERDQGDMRAAQIGRQYPLTELPTQHQHHVTFGDADLEAKIFPWLFPYGTGSWRPDCGISLFEYTKTRVKSVCERWSLDVRWLSFQFDRIIRARMKGFSKTVFISDQGRTNPLTAGDVAEDGGAKYGTIMPNTIPGIKEYFSAKWLDLRAIRRKLGHADLFITLTLNENDPILKQYLNGTPPGDAPVQVTLFFFKKFEVIKSLLWGKDSIFGPVKAHWRRVEYQNRGAPHIHLFLWLYKKIAVEEIDQFVQATIPRGDDELSFELQDLIKTFQLHTCRERCKKGHKPGDAPDHCCFGFPYAVNAQTHLKEGHMRYTYRRDHPDEGKVSPYNAALLYAWKAHVNIQVMTDSQMDEYACKYVVKAEPETFAAVNDDDTRFQKYLKLRVVSLCEIAAYLCGFHTIECTEEVINLNTGPDDHQWRAFKPKETLRRIASSKSGESLYLPTLREKYCERPDELEAVTFIEYVEQHQCFQREEDIPRARREPPPPPTFVNQDYDDDDDDDNDDNDQQQQQHNDPAAPPVVLVDKAGRFVVKRVKEVTARWRYLSPTDGEPFYLQLLILKLPFRSTAFITPHENHTGTFKEECVLRELIVQGEEAEKQLQKKVEDEYGVPGFKRKAIRAAAAALLAAKAAQGEDDASHAGVQGELEEALNFAGQDTEELRRILLPAIQDVRELRRRLQQVAEMTSSQQRVFTHVSALFQRGDQALVCVSGPGGTGKSFLIGLLQAQAVITYGLDVILLAPSGTAANLLKGQTIHHFLRLGIDLKGRLQLGTVDADEVVTANVIIIDEMSMMGADLFHVVQDILRQFGDPGKPFGGKSVLLFGDFFQLPAIGSESIFSSPLFKKFAQFPLTENVRQGSDQQFAGVLHKVRIGLVDSDVVEILTTRRCGLGHPNTDECHPELDARAVILTSKRVARDHINRTMLSALPGKLVVLDSTFEPAHIPFDLKDAMPRQIRVKVGARVVLTRNLDVSRGLVNGAIGTLLDINERYLQVRFDGVPEAEFVMRVRQRIEGKEAGIVVQYQFPLELAWALTVHRVQGMTLAKVYVLLDDTFFANGQAYVALSRVRHLHDLHLLAFDPQAIKADKNLLALFPSAARPPEPFHKAGQVSAAAAPPPPRPPAPTRRIVQLFSSPGHVQLPRGTQLHHHPPMSLPPQPPQPPQPQLQPQLPYEFGYPWSDNSCHLDSFIEACYACVRAINPLWLTQEPTDLYLELQQQMGGAEELLALGLRVRHFLPNFDLQQAREFRERLRNRIVATYREDGRGRTGQMSDPFYWVESCCSESAGRPPLRLFGIHFLETESCECQSFSTPRLRNLLVLHRREEGTTLQQIVQYHLLHEERQQAQCGLCHTIPRLTLANIDPPAIIPFNLEGPASLDEVVNFGEHRYGIVAAIRHPQAHFIAYVKKENRWFLYDDNSNRGPYLFPVPRLKNEASMSGARSLFFLGRLQ